MRKGWKKLKLGELCVLTRGHNPPKKNFITEPKKGYVRFYQIRDGWSDDYTVYVPDTTQLHRVEPEEILMVAYRHIGRVFRGVTGAFNVALCKIANRDRKILNDDFLFYMIPTDIIKGELMKRAERSLIPSMSVVHLKEIKIPIPPLPEQQQIVNILDQAFAAIDKAKANIERNLQNAKELFQSELNQIFSQKGEGWEEKTFMELSTRIGDGLHGTPKYDEEGEYYFVNGNNLNNGRIEIKENTKRINEKEYQKHKRELNQNTVLVSINGTLGKVAFYDNEPVVLGKSACYINFIKEVNKHYIKFLIKSPLFFENMRNESTGATIKNFSLKSMRNYKLHLPPLDVQKLIVERLETLEEYIETIQNNLEKKNESLDELKKSILQKAFAGELTDKEYKITEPEQLLKVAEGEFSNYKNSN